MRWMLCCVWLTCCSLDTSSRAAGTSSAEDTSKNGGWAPRDTAGGRTRSGASSATDAEAPSQDAEPSPATSSRPGAGGSAGGGGAKADAMDGGRSQPKPSSSTMPARPDAAVAIPMGMSNAPTMSSTPARDAAADAAPVPPVTTDASLPLDAGAPTDPAPPLDASTDEAAQGASDLLVWFALTGNNQQRRALYPLIADLEGTRMIDSDGLLSVLRNFDELQCRRNAPVCYQVCIWATSHCDICEGWECRRLMYQSCGADCRSDEESP